MNGFHFPKLLYINTKQSNLFVIENVPIALEVFLVYYSIISFANRQTDSVDG